MSKWTYFWQNYRIVEIKDDNDLLYQVGLTVNGKPISKEVFQIIVNDGRSNLNLSSNDNLLDLCCGNGLITFELSKFVNKAIGVDVSEPFIANAKKYKNAQNLEYIVHDVVTLDKIEALKRPKINKVFMYGALAYFNYQEAETLINSLKKITSKDCRIFIGNVLDKDRMWNFYNTPKKKIKLLYQS